MDVRDCVLAFCERVVAFWECEVGERTCWALGCGDWNGVVDGLAKGGICEVSSISRICVSTELSDGSNHLPKERRGLTISFDSIVEHTRFPFDGPANLGHNR